MGVRVFCLLAATKVFEAGDNLVLNVALGGKNELTALSNTGWRTPAALVHQNLGMSLHSGQVLRSHSHDTWFITRSGLCASLSRARR
jgi:hypothetical protein